MVFGLGVVLVFAWGAAGVLSLFTKAVRRPLLLEKHRPKVPTRFRG